MTTFATLLLLNSLAGLFLGCFVTFQSTKKPVHKAFMVLCCIYAYMCLIQFMTLQSHNPQAALFWSKAVLFGFFTLPIMVHFAMIYTGRSKMFHIWWIWVVLYGPVVAFSVLTLLTDLIISGVEKTDWGFEAIGGPVALFFVHPHAAFLHLLAIILVTVYVFRLDDPKEKRQAQYVALGLLAPFLWVHLSPFLSTALDMALPDMKRLGLGLMTGIIGFAIWRYDLFALNPVTAANNIIATMPDLLFLIRPNGEIASINQSVAEALGFDEEDVIRRSVTDFVSGKAVQDLFRGKEGEHGLRHLEATLMGKDGARIPAGVAISTLKEKDGSLAAYVFIVRDMTEQKKVETEQEALIEELQEALANVKTLKGLVPICSGCKKIRNDKGYWQQVEAYIKENTQADFSHGICDDCAKQLYPEAFLDDEEGDESDT
jgi:PAS domain S-box-containing protein